MDRNDFNPLRETVYKIMDEGGYVNAHSHLDRAYTVNEKTLKRANDHLFKKWLFVDELKSRSNVQDYFERITTALANQAFLRTQAICSFIDIDSVCGQNALAAARLAVSEYPDIKLVIACQTLKGVLEKEQRIIIEKSLDDVDIIGSLPGADSGREDKHLDIVMGWAKDLGKRLHVHVDQLNSPLERETELLARKIMQHGLEGRVTAIHSISVAAHKKEYRNEVYKMAKDAGLSFITCPSAWIDHKRNETLVPSHNAITPVDELLQHGLVVALGSDNICDVYKPFCDGDMLNELRLLIDACRIYDPYDIINIAVHNGKEVMGMNDE
jgi:cytosine/adenosine deaminase-related metal-dependent hydrolase